MPELDRELLRRLPRRLRAELDENTCRKDLTQSELADLQANLIEELSRPELKQQGRRTDLETCTENAVQVEKSSRRQNVTERVARFFGESERTVRKRLDVRAAANAEPGRFGKLCHDMDRTGRVDAAHKELRCYRRKDADAAALEAAKERAKSQNTIDIRQCGVTELDWIEDESVDAIITDPPYPEEFLPLFTDLSRAAARILKPGGSAFVMSGQTFLPEVIARLGEALTYHWQFSYRMPGPQCAVHAAKVNNVWKPVFWFSKGEPTLEWVQDEFESGAREKDDHHWRQSESGMTDLVERLTRPNDLVCDPFLGGGTTAVVCRALSRRFVGSDIDAAAVNTSMVRLFGKFAAE